MLITYTGNGIPISREQETSNNNSNNKNNDHDHDHDHNDVDADVVEQVDATSTNEERFSEWRIRTSADGVVMAKGFRNSDFRNPLSGESVLPLAQYLNLFQEIVAKARGVRCRFATVLVCLYFTALIAPSFIVQSSWEYSGFYWILCFALMLLMGFGVAHVVMAPIYRTFDHHMYELIGNRREGYAERYQIELGYTPKTKGFRIWSDDSHVWLRRHYQPQVEVPSDARDLGAYPAIYISLMVPGDIHADEKEYDPSMIVDENTWKIIHETHVKTSHSRWPSILFLLVFIPSFFAGCLAVMWQVVSFGTVAIGFAILYGFIFPIVFICAVDKWLVRKYLQVADEVTRIFTNDTEFLAQKKDGSAGEWDSIPVPQHMAAYALELDESPLQHRPGAAGRRYQLVRQSAPAISGEMFPSTDEAEGQDSPMDDDRLQIV